MSETTSVMSFPSKHEDVKLHVDQKCDLRLRLAKTFPLSLGSPIGSWGVDGFIEDAPWRPLPPCDAPQNLTLRLVVLLAWDAARTAQARARGENEARAVLTRGYSDSNVNLLKTLTRAASRPDRPLTPDEMSVLIQAVSLCRRLGVNGPPEVADDNTCPALATWLHEVREKISFRAGRQSLVDVNVFFETLLRFWDGSMTRRAASSRRANVNGRRGKGFHDFVEAAAHDAGYRAFGIERGVSRVVEAVRSKQKSRGRASAAQSSPTPAGRPARQNRFVAA